MSTVQQLSHCVSSHLGVWIEWVLWRPLRSYTEYYSVDTDSTAAYSGLRPGRHFSDSKSPKAKGWWVVSIFCISMPAAKQMHPWFGKLRFKVGQSQFVHRSGESRDLFVIIGQCARDCLLSPVLSLFSQSSEWSMIQTVSVCLGLPVSTGFSVRSDLPWTLWHLRMLCSTLQPQSTFRLEGGSRNRTIPLSRQQKKGCW